MKPVISVPDEKTSPLDLSVIIPAHERPDSLTRLLASIVRTSDVKEIIVVDDGSNPPLRVTDSRVCLIRNDSPRLVSFARNAGAAHATGDVLVFVDDDCVLQPKTLHALIKAFGQEPVVGLTGPVITYLELPRTIWCAGVERSTWTGLTHFRCKGVDVSRAATIEKKCEDFPSVFAIRRRLFEEIGGFDINRFPFHMAEADLANQVRVHGYEVRLVPEAIAFHDISPRASVARRVHIPSGERAKSVARDRVRFILYSGAPSRRRLAALMFWMVVLVPAYLVGILMERGRPVGERLKTAWAFLWGNIEGLRGQAGHAGKAFS